MHFKLYVFFCVVFIIFFFIRNSEYHSEKFYYLLDLAKLNKHNWDVVFQFYRNICISFSSFVLFNFSSSFFFLSYLLCHD